MFVVHSYPLAVTFCVVTMLGWGSWANAKKLARPDWRFDLFYWDYTLGMLLFTLILGLTMGSSGTESRPFLADLAQASSASIISALVGGAIFNLANILLVAAIEISGMAVAYPVGIGLALIIGVIVNYRAAPVGNVALLAAAMYPDPADAVNGKMGPYAAVFVLAAGILLSNFVWNTLAMKKPFVGTPVGFRDYFAGRLDTHLAGVVGGVIWAVGMSFNLIASGRAGFAISYALGQGATMIAAFWGVFIWKEFRMSPPGT
jgi:glucose uptake protein